MEVLDKETIESQGCRLSPASKFWEYNGDFYIYSWDVPFVSSQKNYFKDLNNQSGTNDKYLKIDIPEKVEFIKKLKIEMKIKGIFYDFRKAFI